MQNTENPKQKAKHKEVTREENPKEHQIIARQRNQHYQLGNDFYQDQLFPPGGQHGMGVP